MDQMAEPKLVKLFLNHSGTQKDFVHQLCVDLERVSYNPFFDIKHQSLEKGAPFPNEIFKAIRQSWVFIVVLSEEYFCKTTWPMRELASAVEARETVNPKLKILPLFFRLSYPEFKSEERRAKWFKQWDDWASATSRIDIPKWKAALKVVETFIGFEFMEGQGEVPYRQSIVKTICRICPNIVFDDSHVVGRERFCRIVRDKFDDRKCATKCDLDEPLRIGLSGVGGMGKTTLCKVMCNHYFAEFGGIIIHVNLSLEASVERLKKVILKLTGATQDELSRITDRDEGRLQVKRIASNHMVFLALDNVSHDPQILEEALWYLSLKYGAGSMILVTSRSFDVLHSKLKISKSHCMEIPDLNVNEAITLFLQAESNKTTEFSAFNHDEKLRIQDGVRRGLFMRKMKSGGQFHPLALKALGFQLNSLICKPKEWYSALSTFYLKDHTIFSVLGSAIQMLPREERLIFMDIALYRPSCVILLDDVCKWLSVVHRLTVNRIQEHLSSLRAKSLLEECPEHGVEDENSFHDNSAVENLQEWDSHSSSQVVVHESYIELAKMMSKGESLVDALCFANEGGNDVPLQMQDVPTLGHCWPLKRMAFINGKFRSLTECNLGKYFINVQVLRLEYLALNDLDLAGMFCLASVDIMFCEELKTVNGLQTLRRLVWLRVARCEKLEPLPNLEGLSMLQHVELRHLSRRIGPRISNCPGLYELRLCGLYSVYDLSTNVRSLDGLKKMVIEWCPYLHTMPPLQEFQHLLELYILDCPSLDEVLEVGSLQALRKLYIRGSGIRTLVGIGNLHELRELVCNLEPCVYWGSLPGLPYLTKLEVLNIANWKCTVLEDMKLINNMRHTLQSELFVDSVDVDHMMEIFEEETQFGVVGNSHRDKDDILGWTCILLERTFTSVGGTLSNCSRASEYRYLIANINMRSNCGDDDSETTLCFFRGASIEQMYKLLPENYIIMRTMDFTEKMFQSSKEMKMTRELSNITVLHLRNLCIEHVDLSEMRCLSEIKMKNCGRLLSPVILEDMAQLKYVKLKYCRYLYRNVIALRTRRCPQLQEVIISRCKGLHFVFFYGVGYDCPQKLSIDHCPGLEDIHNGELSDCFLNLQEVQVIHCPQLAVIVSRFLNISVLHLYALSLDLVRQLQLRGEYFTRMKCLKRLEMIYCGQILGAITLVAMPSLEFVKLDDCSDITELHTRECPQLCEVIISSCIKCRFIFQSGDTYNNLEKLSISGLPFLIGLQKPPPVTDDAVYEHPLNPHRRHGPHVIHEVIDHIESYTFPLLQSKVRAYSHPLFPNLQELRVTDCGSLVTKLNGSFQKLQKLHWMSTPVPLLPIDLNSMPSLTEVAFQDCEIFEFLDRDPLYSNSLLKFQNNLDQMSWSMEEVDIPNGTLIMRKKEL